LYIWLSCQVLKYSALPSGQITNPLRNPDLFALYAQKADNIGEGLSLPESIPHTQVRKEYTLKAYLIDENGVVCAQQTFEFVVFPDVKLPENTETVWITDLEKGTYFIAGEEVTVRKTPRRRPYFLSRKTGHPAVEGFGPKDFRMWYSKELDRLAPLATYCFKAEGFRPVLIWNGAYDPYMVIGEKMYEGKRYIICLAYLRMENPPAKHLYANLLNL
jgi:hypothetical protein